MPLDPHHLAADRAALFSPQGFAELVEYRPGGEAEPVRAYALFGKVETSSEKGGVVGDRVACHVATFGGSVLPARRKTLVRDPDGAAEEWEVAGISVAGGLFRLDLVKNGRPTP